MKTRDPRHAVHLPARMKNDEDWCDVSIRNVSRHGVMIQLPKPPERGSYVEIRRQSLVIVGRVVWSRHGACGLRTREALSIAALNDLAAKEPGDHSGEPGTERRRRPRAAQDVAEASAAAARRMQFAFLGAGCAAGVAALAIFAFHIMAGPAAAIAAVLG